MKNLVKNLIVVVIAIISMSTICFGKDIVIANIDSGIDHSKIDVDKLWLNPNEIPGNGIDDDHNGFVDDCYGWDFHDNDNTPTQAYGLPTTRKDRLLTGHGTEIFNGITKFGKGNFKIMPIRIGDDSIGRLKGDENKTLNYAVANGADIVVATSFSYDTFQVISNYAKAYPNIIFIAAVPNDSTLDCSSLWEKQINLIGVSYYSKREDPSAHGTNIDFSIDSFINGKIGSCMVACRIADVCVDLLSEGIEVSNIKDTIKARYGGRDMTAEGYGIYLNSLNTYE